MALDLVIERVSESGRNNLESLQSQVVRSPLNNLTILIREFAQNSWDARIKGYEPKLHVEGFELSDQQAGTLAENVFTDHERSGAVALSSWLKARNRHPLTALVLSDWGTIGLGGGVDPRVADGDQRSHWTSYLHDLGVGQEGPHKGGRYGVGRTSSFSISGVRAIVVYTRALLSDGSRQSRLIAVAHGGKLRQGNKRLTGRVWWGRPDDRDSAKFARPLTGKSADRLAEALGMSRRDDSDTGLSVMILDPILQDPEFNDCTDMRSALEMIADSICWNLWPKFVDQRDRAMSFSVACGTDNVDIQDPQEHPILKHFVTTAEVVRRPSSRRDEPADKGPVAVRPIRWRQRIVGYLALSAVVIAERDFKHGEEIRRIGGVSQPHHVLLMRQPELVVDYLEMKPTSLPGTGVVGVFVPLDEFDHSFSLAEPPAHDRWSVNEIDEGLTEDRSIVRVSMERMKQEYEDFLSELEGKPSASKGSEVLQEASRRLSEILLSQNRSAQQVRRTRASASSRKDKAGRVEFVEAIPSIEEGLGRTLWRGKWIPGTSPPKAITLTFTAAPSDQASNLVQIKGQPPVMIDTTLGFSAAHVSNGTAKIDGCEVRVKLEHPDRVSDIELSIVRRRELGVDLRVDLSVDTAFDPVEGEVRLQ
jgi:vacuolar-type H+-ATPase subunit H